MLAVFVEFEFENDARERAAKIATEVAPTFEGMPGLRTKAFTVDPSGRRATNVYVWDADDAARGFFNDELVERVTGLYGVRPTVRFAEVVGLVVNAPASTG
ncbi:MAG: YdhR family protein [Nocardioidaceae bacterium]